ncbi:hypothetical protein [Streptomonospora salina]|uniref:hypothetical protein n=1 Tax=Streptomonospora salina TaxID=104205 RepID=UPI0035F0A259
MATASPERISAAQTSRTAVAAATVVSTGRLVSTAAAAKAVTTASPVIRRVRSG